MTAVRARQVDPHAITLGFVKTLAVADWQAERFPDATVVWTGPDGRQVFLSGTATSARLSGPGFTLSVSGDADPALFEALLTAAIDGLATPEVDAATGGCGRAMARERHPQHTYANGRPCEGWPPQPTVRTRP